MVQAAWEVCGQQQAIAARCQADDLDRIASRSSPVPVVLMGLVVAVILVVLRFPLFLLY